MPYNTTAIPPRKEATGQTQLPLSRVKKIVAVDSDISQCSNNAAFVMTLAAEMFVQYLANEAQNMARLERKPRRNLQYKDLANAVLHHDNLEFLEDVIPKTTPYRQVKEQAASTRARMRGEKPADEAQQGKKQQRPIVNGSRGPNGFGGPPLVDGDPNAQLEMEMRQAEAANGEDVEMVG